MSYSYKKKKKPEFETKKSLSCPFKSRLYDVLKSTAGWVV